MSLPKYAAVFFAALLLISGCESQKAQEKQEIQTSKIDVIRTRANNVFLKTGADIDVKQIGQFFDITVTYNPSKALKGKTDDKSFLDATYNFVRRLSLADSKVRIITLRTTSTSPTFGEDPGNNKIIRKGSGKVTRETTYLQITKQEFEDISKKPDAKEELAKLIRTSEFYKVEKAIRQAGNIAEYFVKTEKDNRTNSTRAVITYTPARVEKLGESDRDFDNFERTLANTAKRAFESSDSIGEIEITVKGTKPDNRSNNKTDHIAKLSMTREEFNEITVNWDDLRSRIYNKIKYNPLILLDMKSSGRIEKLETGKETHIRYSLDKYQNIDKTISTIEKDAVETAWALLERYPDINKVIFDAKAMIPAPEGEVTIDGVHKILQHAFKVSISRNDAEKINRNKLTDRQVLFNFKPEWDKDILKENIKTKSGAGEYVRKIEIDGDRAEIYIDSCKWKRTSRNKAGVVENSIVDTANNLMFYVHPPYLNQVSISVEKVFIDQYGNENAEAIVSVTIKRNESAQWYNPSIEELDSWYDITSKENSITEETVLCQIKTT